MDASDDDVPVASVAAAIAEPARARMLCCLLDGRARTSTELAIVGGVSPPTASVHLARLSGRRLVKVVAEGRHRYYSLSDSNVAAALEALTVVAGSPSGRFVPNTPMHLRAARTCYDHMAGALAVALHDYLLEQRWLSRTFQDASEYEVTSTGEERLGALGLDFRVARAARRRYACPCLDWSERRPHLAGAIGAGLLNVVLRRKWVVRDMDSRALRVTRAGQHGFRD